MKTITKYKADDGTEFNDVDACATYEALCGEVEQVLSALTPPPKDDGCEFANGGGFVQHDPATFRATRDALLKIIGRVMPHKFVDQMLADPDKVHPSWVGRLVDDSGARPLNRAWSRISCVDKQYREWGQPYFALNPDKGQQVRVNP